MSSGPMRRSSSARRKVRVPKAVLRQGLRRVLLKKLRRSTSAREVLLEKKGDKVENEVKPKMTWFQAAQLIKPSAPLWEAPADFG